MDKFMESAFDNQSLVEMSERLALVINRTDDKARPICAKNAASLLSDAKHTAVSLPRQVGGATLNCGKAANMEARV